MTAMPLSKAINPRQLWQSSAEETVAVLCSRQVWTPRLYVKEAVVEKRHVSTTPPPKKSHSANNICIFMGEIHSSMFLIKWFAATAALPAERSPAQTSAPFSVCCCCAEWWSGFTWAGTLSQCSNPEYRHSPAARQHKRTTVCVHVFL